MMKELHVMNRNKYAIWEINGNSRYGTVEREKNIISSEKLD